ncbi:MAG: hypothetical protein IPK04_17175 [Bdellovibrionales bacterium]|nr:hypothetical protein [Bdellovibrionales bacterium]
MHNRLASWILFAFLTPILIGSLTEARDDSKKSLKPGFVPLEREVYLDYFALDELFEWGSKNPFDGMVQVEYLDHGKNRRDWRQAKVTVTAPKDRQEKECAGKESVLVFKITILERDHNSKGRLYYKVSIKLLPDETRVLGNKLSRFVSEHKDFTGIVSSRMVRESSNSREDLADSIDLRWVLSSFEYYDREHVSNDYIKINLSFSGYASLTLTVLTTNFRESNGVDAGDFIYESTAREVFSNKVGPSYDVNASCGKRWAH